jgi:predicted ATPase
MTTPGELAQTRLFEAFLTLVGRVGSMAPVALVLEDLHWADAATRDLTAFLARNARDERLCVIGTYRSDELHRRHPLRAWLAEMQRLASVDLVRLAPFDATESAAQIGAILGAEPESTVVASIHERAEGNPFFAEELLAAGATGPGDQLPASLRDVLLARAYALSEPARRLLGVVAVGGRAADELLLARVTGMTEAEVATALDEATSQNLLVASDDGTAAGYAFRHALLREALYDDLLPGARRRLHAGTPRCSERSRGSTARPGRPSSRRSPATPVRRTTCHSPFAAGSRRLVRATPRSRRCRRQARTSGPSSSGTSSRRQTGPKGSSTSSCSRMPRARSSPAAT